MEDVIELGLVDEEDIALDRAALSLAALDHPDADLDGYEAVLDAIVERLADEGDDADTADAQAAALARVLGGEFGFEGDRDTYDHPDNADLIRVIDRRRGLPIALSILYVAAARQLGWTANVLDIPGHVLVAIGGVGMPTVIDPFRSGAVVEAEALAALVAQASGGEPAVRRIAAMPSRAVLVRLLQNQASRAEQAGKAGRSLVLYERMTMFAPSYGHPWWERARLELVDGRVGDARTSLSAMLEVTREPELRAKVSDILKALASA